MRFRVFLAAASLLTALGVSAAAASGLDSGWRWPLDGQPTVARGFDPPPQPWLAGHRGVDLRARDGDRVLAVGSGVVGYAGLLAGRGVVTVRHPRSLETTYEPVAATVHAGDHVDAGQVVGHVTRGHGNCGVGYVCLHWGLRRGTTYLDPLQLVRSTHVRLLPIFGGTPPTATAPLRPTAPPANGPRETASASPDSHRASPAGDPAAPVVAALGLAALGGVIAARRGGSGQARPP